MEEKTEITKEATLDESIKETDETNDKEKPNYILLGVIALLLIGLFGYGAYGGAKTSYEDVDVLVRLGWLNQGQFAGIYVAEEKGYYKDFGLNVRLLELDHNIDQVDEVGFGEVDFSIMEANQMISGFERGHDLRAVAAIYQISPHALASKSDSGIKTPLDLKGKTIGLAGGEGEGDTIFKIFLERFLEEDDVVFKNLGFDTVDDFKNNRADVIDVYKIDQPYLASQEGIDLNIISLDAYGFDTYGDVIVTRDSFIKENRDVVARFVEATLKGWQYVVDNPSDAVLITLPYTKGNYYDEGYQRHIIFESVPLVKPESGKLGEMSVVPWSTLYESMLAVGVVSVDIDIRDVYTNEFIK